MENLGIGLQLMIVGMCTVFLILLIVIYGGKLLIKVVNRIAPEEMAAVKKIVQASTDGADPSVMAVLSETVRQLTGGKGHISSVRRI